MKIGEITNSAEYQMDELNQNLPIFGIKLWFSKLKKKFHIFIIDKLKKNNQSSEIVEFPKLENIKNFKFVKLSKFKKFPIW